MRGRLIPFAPRASLKRNDVYYLGDQVERLTLAVGRLTAGQIRTSEQLDQLMSVLTKLNIEKRTEHTSQERPQCPKN